MGDKSAFILCFVLPMTYQSLSFLFFLVVQMLLAILSICTAEELEESSEDEETKKELLKVLLEVYMSGGYVEFFFSRRSF